MRMWALLRVLPLLIALLLTAALQGCAAASPAAPSSPSPEPATPTPEIPGLPADCVPLLRYQSGDRYGSPCVYSLCQDGRVIREGGPCPSGPVPERLTASQLAEIEKLVAASDFFALESHYRAPDGC